MRAAMMLLDKLFQEDARAKCGLAEAERAIVDINMSVQRSEGIASLHKPNGDHRAIASLGSGGHCPLTTRSSPPHAD